MGIITTLLYVLLGLGSIFIVLLVLIQRGKGGGLAGALGGMGGYSAFGTRAGDLFTKITIVAAALWILGAMLLARINLVGSTKYNNPGATSKTAGSPSGAANATTVKPEEEQSGEKDSSATSFESGKPAKGRFLDNTQPSGKQNEAGSDSDSK